LGAVGSWLREARKMPVLSYTLTTLEAGVGIGPLSPQLRAKSADFPEGINLNLLNQTILILTGLVSVLVSGAADAISPRQVMP
jgi:hypothetical protein